MRAYLLNISFLALLAAVAVSPTSAKAETTDAPRIANARLEQRTGTEPLGAELRKWVAQASQAQWLGYSVPQVAGERGVCCGGYWNRGVESACGTYRLESEDEMGNASSRETAPEPAVRGNLLVLLRAQNGRIVKIRLASEECAIDAGGLAFVWLGSVSPEQSIAFLETVLDDGDLKEHGQSTGHSALMAIALHADPAANRALERFTGAQQPEPLRKQAAFWLGVARGAEGVNVLRKLAQSDPSQDVRAHVAFALSLNKNPAAVDEMIRMAREDESAHVRSQAIFWLGQKAGRQAASTISAAIENDPDTEVKTKAVFALSQLPKDEGVPRLIQVARTHRNPAVRQGAMFWLGQSHDPRALTFFEEVLSH